jgi:hypothetical protein
MSSLNNLIQRSYIEEKDVMSKKQIFVLALVGILIFALGAQLATAQPIQVRIGDTTIQFLPLVISSKAAEAPTGVLYVFNTTVSVDGAAGGRSEMDNACFSEDPDAHFCHMDEIESAWITGVHFQSFFEPSWVDNFSGTNWADGIANCSGWILSDDFITGTTIYSRGTGFDNKTCDTVQRIACCKRIP